MPASPPPTAYAGGHDHRFSAYGGIPSQPETTARDAGATRLLNRQYQRGACSAAASDRRRRHHAGYSRGQPGASGLVASTRCQPGLPLTARKRHIAEQIGLSGCAEAAFSGYPAQIRSTGGHALYLRTAAEVQQAADAMIDRVKLAPPQARIHGLLVQSMANRAGAQELRVVC